jgi:hypothetical protein
MYKATAPTILSQFYVSHPEHPRVMKMPRSDFKSLIVELQSLGVDTAIAETAKSGLLVANVDENSHVKASYRIDSYQCTQQRTGQFIVELTGEAKRLTRPLTDFFPRAKVVNRPDIDVYYNELEAKIKEPELELVGSP